MAVVSNTDKKRKLKDAYYGDRYYSEQKKQEK